MKARVLFGIGLCLALLLVLAVGLTQAQAPVPQGEATTLAAPVGTAFTYQGRLIKDGNPVNGTADFQFSLWDAATGGTQIGTIQTKTNVNVTNGVFTIPDLDFGATAFMGEARWLAISVRSPAGSGSYQPLTPRQALTAAPYALSLRPGAVVSGTLPAITGRSGDAFGQLASLYIVSIWPPLFYPVGVYGSGTWGVYGYSASAIGVYGTSADSSGTGVLGLAQAVTGTTKAIYGRAQSPDGYGGYFENTATGGTAYGVYGKSNSTEGWGVQGHATAASGNTIGVYGRADSPGGTGVWGYGTATSGGAIGVYGLTAAPSGKGVWGFSQRTSGTNYGVYGEARSPDGYGGYFVNNATTGGVGLYCRGFTNADADLVLGGTTAATGDDGRLYSDPAYTSSDIMLFSNDEYQFHLDEDSNESSNFDIYNGANIRVFRVDESGNITASGTKGAAVAAGEYGTRKMYAIESTGVWFEDFGTAQLKDGLAIVEIDPVFAETVNLEVGYHVFLTPVGGWASLYVANKTPTSFEVRDAEGKANITFDYRIVAKRAGYEDVRMEPMALTLEDEQ